MHPQPLRDRVTSLVRKVPHRPVLIAKTLLGEVMVKDRIVKK
jgi:hypothetical protein